MAFLKRLFSRKEKTSVEPMHGVGPLQTEAEQGAVRSRMEAEMASERERRSESAAPKDPEDKPPRPAP